jgi:hypothetical protein
MTFQVSSSDPEGGTADYFQQQRPSSAIPSDDPENLARFICVLASVSNTPDSIFENLVPLCGKDQSLKQAVFRAHTAVINLQSIQPSQRKLALMHGAVIGGSAGILPADAAHPDTFEENAGENLTPTFRLCARVITNYVWNDIHSGVTQTQAHTHTH